MPAPIVIHTTHRTHIDNHRPSFHRPSSIAPRSSIIVPSTKPPSSLAIRSFVLSSYRLAHFVVTRASRATSGFGSGFYFSLSHCIHTTIAVSLPLSSLYHVTSGSLARDRAPLTSVVATHLGDYACCPSHPVIRKGVDNSIWSRCSDSVTGRSSALSTFPWVIDWLPLRQPKTYPSSSSPLSIVTNRGNRRHFSFSTEDPLVKTL
jgi:hypothetical protein